MLLVACSHASSCSHVSLLSALVGRVTMQDSTSNVATGTWLDTNLMSGCSNPKTFQVTLAPCLPRESVACQITHHEEMPLHLLPPSEKAEILIMPLNTTPETSSRQATRDRR